MSISSISSMQSQPVSGLIAPQHAHHKKELDGSTAAALIASTGFSTANANQLASAIAGALTQLGLTSAPSSGNAVATNNTPLVPLPQPPKASQQVQQYKNVASTFSNNLAEALSSSSSSASSTASGASGLTTVFQNLWASLGSSSATAADASASTIPGFQSFLQTLARNFSEGGISGLRGMFVNTVV